MFISRHTLKWTKTCRSSGDFPHAHTAHFLLNRHSRQAPRSTRNRLAAHGPAVRGPGHVAAARPRTRPGPPGPARPVRFALAGREPRVASDLPADRGRMPSRHHGHAAHARPVAHLDPDDLPFLFRQVRIHLAQGATPLRLAIRTISNLTGAALSFRQRGITSTIIPNYDMPPYLGVRTNLPESVGDENDCRWRGL